MKLQARIHATAEPPHVAVVGAGFAGLRCADVLLQCGFKVTILEGRNRVGGRVYQHRLPNGHMADLGPNWIHGTIDNPIYDIAMQTRTVISTWDHNPHIFGEEGNLLDANEAVELSDKMWEIVLQAFQFSNRNCATTSVDESLYQFFERKSKTLIPDATGSEDQEQVELKRKALLQMSEMWGAFVGSSIHTQSLKYFWLEECLEGGELSFLCDITHQGNIRANCFIQKTCCVPVHTPRSSR